MKILNKKGTKESSTGSMLTAGELIMILVSAAVIMLLIPSVIRAVHWFLSNQVELVPVK